MTGSTSVARTRTEEERVERAARFWRESIALGKTLGATYLGQRLGISPARLPAFRAGADGWPRAFRWHVGRRALVAAVHEPQAPQLSGVHMIHLDTQAKVRLRDDGSPLVLSYGVLRGAAVHCSFQPDEDGRWGAAEGLDASLLASVRHGFPISAALGAANMRNVIPPSWARTAVVIAGSHAVGVVMAEEAAQALRDLGLSARVIEAAA